MPVPLKVRTPRPAAPSVDTRRAPTAMDPGPAAVVRARTLVGNAAVTAAMGGLPRGAEPGPSGWRGQMLLVGQDLVGNQAVATQAGTQAPAGPVPVAPATAAPAVGKKPAASPATRPKAAVPPVPKPDQKDRGTEPATRPDKGEAKKKDATGPRSPSTDPKFQALKKDVNAKKKTVGASHPPARAEAGAAQAAAVPPADDREARGKAAHAEDMDAAQPKEFDKTEFVRAVEDAVTRRAPNNLDEADKFGASGKAEEVKAEVQGKVGEGKDASAREIADTTAQTPQPAPDAKEVVPLAPDKVPGKPGTPNPNQAAPDVLPPSATDMSDGPAQVNQQMADAQVTEQQLSFRNSREPAFDKAVRDKKTMEAHATTAPGQLRAGEAKELKQVKNTAAAQGSVAMVGMHGTRVTTGHQVGTGKAGAKGRDEDKRTQVTTLLQEVFDRTRCDVEKILSELDEKVDDQFTREEKQARDRFTTEHTEGMNRYKDERYSGALGKARWVKDLFADLPEEANRIYERAKANYLTAMSQVIRNIADTIDRELRRAKDRIAAGRKELAAAVDKLPADLRAIGQEAATEFEGRFDELKDTVNDKGTELVDTLATKYSDAVKAVDEEIAAEKEKNKGLVSKAADAIGGIIRTIKELASLLMGVLRKAVSAIGLILRDPIGFLGNLITGVGGGLKLFMRNAGRHLQQGVLAWLLGTGATAGLQLPATFDVLGILLMLAALLGLSWPTIRSRLARKVPNQAIAAAETAIPLVAETRKRGVAGMWNDLRTRVGDLRKELVSNLVSYLLPTIIIAGVTWIVSLFNPASAFIRACKMIIDIIRFIVTQGRQIIEFVNAVLDAVIAIARGGTGGVPALIERALARSIPVLIGALAAILGLGGIAGKVKQIFQKLARPVNRAVDQVINKIVGLVKKLWAKLRAAVDRRRRRGKPEQRAPRRRRPDDRVRRRPDRRDRKDEKSPARQQKELMAALREAGALAERTGDEDVVRDGLPAIRARHRLTSLTVTVNEGSGAQDRFLFAGVINPRATFAQLAVNRPLKLAQDAYKRGNIPFGIDDILGSTGVITQGLKTTLGMSAGQARKYAEEWVDQGRLTATKPTKGPHIYSFVALPVHKDLIRPEFHPEFTRWMSQAAAVPLPAADARKWWFLIIEGMRFNRRGNLEVVAREMMVTMRIPRGKGALWSGGKDLITYAMRSGYTLLESQQFYEVTNGLKLLDDFDVVRPVWEAFSKRYASALQGGINVFARKLASPSVLMDTELPAVEATRTAGIAVSLHFHAMAWGDDPRVILSEALANYFEELDAAGNPQGRGRVVRLDQGAATHATQVAEARFNDSQDRKRRGIGPPARGKRP